MNKTQLSDRECIALDMYNAFFSFLHDEDDVATENILLHKNHLSKIVFDFFDSALMKTKKNWRQMY